VLFLFSFAEQVIFVLSDLVVVKQACVPVAVSCFHHVVKQEGILGVKLLTKEAED